MAVSNQKGNVAVRIIKSDSKVRASSQVTDPFQNIYDDNLGLKPAYDPLVLAKFAEISGVLQPLTDAYATNIPGFGYFFRYNIDMDSPDVDQKIKDRAEEEWITLENFYKFCNFQESFVKILKKVIEDREKVGWGGLEVIPRGDGRPGGLAHIPAHTFRVTYLHKEPQELRTKRITSSGKELIITHMVRFRRFVQIREDGEYQTVWFKEFGDPRKMDKNTGLFEGDEGQGPISFENEANSLIYLPIYNSYSPYGLPRWLGNIVNAYGARKAEELNYTYFTRGKHIPMAILVKNGLLTESSVEKLEEYGQMISGVENAHAYLVLEASGFEEEGFENTGGAQKQVDIKLQPLTQAMQQDGLFQEYDKNTRDKMRESLRLPPIYMGASRDYTRATADTARAIAEEQIFNPERSDLADVFNRAFNQAFDIRYVEMYFKGPELSNKLELSQALKPYIDAGGITPNMLLKATSELLGQPFEFIKEEWGSQPLQITLAELAVKAKEAGATPEGDPEVDPETPVKEPKIKTPDKKGANKNTSPRISDDTADNKQVD